MSRFYTAAPFGKCEMCDAPAILEVRGPFNAVYGHVCKRHAAQKLARLEAAWKETPAAEMPKVGRAGTAVGAR